MGSNAKESGGSKAELKLSEKDFGEGESWVRHWKVGKIWLISVLSFRKSQKYSSEK